MLRLLCLYLFVNIAALPLRAQIFDTAAFSGKPSWSFGFDSKSTLIYNTGRLLSGLRVGAEWKGRYRAGLGYYWLSSRVYTNKTIDNIEIRSRLRIRYIAPYVEYAFIQNTRWELSAQLQPGMGLKDYTYNRNGGQQTTDEGFMTLIDASVSGHYKVLRWIGLSGRLGYRQMILPNAFNTTGLSGPYFGIGLAFFPWSLWELIMNDEDLASPPPPVN